MDIAMEGVLVVLAITATTLLIGGCAAPSVRDKDLFQAYVQPSYLADRRFDALDVVTATVEGPVIGAAVIASPAKIGLMTSWHPTLEGKGGVGIGLGTESRLDGFGLRSGQVGTYEQAESILGAAWDTPPRYRDLTRADIRGKTGKYGVKDNPSQYARVGVAAGLGIGFRLELNFGELLDFVLGFFGIDPMNDDMRHWLRLRGAFLLDTQQLDLRSAGFATLAPEIGDFAELKQLDLTGNELQDLPPTFVKLKNLQELHLRKNKLRQLPPEIARLTGLEKLWLDGGNHIERLPRELGSLANLRELYLGNNALIELPAEIAKLEKIQTLELQNNRLRDLPLELGRLHSLQRLDLSNNPLGKVPAAVFAMERLSKLSLDGVGLQELPEEIGRLPNLQDLTLKNNPIKRLPIDVLARMPNLVNILLEGNQLSCDEVRRVEKVLGRRAQFFGDAVSDCPKTR